MLWRHRDRFTERTEVRRDRRLVVVVLGDARQLRLRLLLVLPPGRLLELEVKLTGIPLASALPAGQPRRPTRRGSAPSCPPPTTSTSSAGGSTSTWTASPTWWRRSTWWPTPVGPANPHGNAFRPGRPRCGGSRGPPLRRSARQPHLAGLQPRRPQRLRRAGRLPGAARAPRRCCWRPTGSTVARRAALRPPPPVGHPLRPRRAARRRRPSHPAPRRRRPARLHGRRTVPSTTAPTSCCG